MSPSASKTSPAEVSGGGIRTASPNSKLPERPTKLGVEEANALIIGVGEAGKEKSSNGPVAVLTSRFAQGSSSAVSEVMRFAVAAGLAAVKSKE